MGCSHSTREEQEEPVKPVLEVTPEMIERFTKQLEEAIIERYEMTRDYGGFRMNITHFVLVDSKEEKYQNSH